MKRSLRKGFTLVELLIVIVVIGILSAMMMLSSTEAVASARASNIVSNMRNLKTAVLAWYMDNMDQLDIHSDYYFYGSAKLSKGTTQFSDNSQNHSYQACKHIQNIAKWEAGRAEMLRYMDNSASISLNKGQQNDDYAEKGCYAVTDGVGATIGTGANNWYIVCYVDNARVQEKLAGKAKSVGLLKKGDALYDASSKFVYMKIIDLSE